MCLPPKFIFKDLMDRLSVSPGYRKFPSPPLTHYDVFEETVTCLHALFSSVTPILHFAGSFIKNTQIMLC